MCKYHRPDIKPLIHTNRTRARRVPRFFAMLPMVLLLCLAVWAQAQGAGPQRAIEALEGCSAKERKQGCITILTRRPAGEGKQAIKAQVRGGRIIWYEYDTRSGKVRRTN